MARTKGGIRNLDLRSSKARQRRSPTSRAPRGWVGLALLVAIGLLIAWGQGGLDSLIPEPARAAAGE